MNYSFSEKSLGVDFCQDIINSIKIASNKGSSLALVGMPLVGNITFCRFLATTGIAYFAYVDTQSLKNKTRNDLFISLYNELEGNNLKKALLNPFEECKNRIRQLVKSHKNIIIIITRIDYMKEELDKGLLANLKSIMDIHVGKITFIVTANQPLNKISSTALYHNPSFLSDNIYFQPFQENDFKKLLSFLPGAKNTNKKELVTIQILSGGHICLMWQLLKTEYLDSPMDDDIIQLHLKTIYDAYSTLQKTQLRKIASGRKIKNVDPFLLKIGLVKELGEEKYELFTPLLRDYILTYAHTKLTRKERKLFYLLKKRLDKLVTKDEIFEEVWGDDPDLGSDWALNSLIYRLRKNPTFVSKGYVIENEKDEGYKMIKEN